MPSQPHVPPDAKIMDKFRHICMRPKMYVGDEGYNATCLFMQGIALGYQDWHGLFYHTWLNDEFREFLIKRYGVGDTKWVNQCSWWVIYPQMLKHGGSIYDDELLFKELLRNFDDYYNILVRMAVEAGDGLEDA